MATAQSGTGIVKWFSADKGFGFIVQDGGGKDLYAHISEMQGAGLTNLLEKQRVAFEVREGPKGPQAANIRLA